MREQESGSTADRNVRSDAAIREYAERCCQQPTGGAFEALNGAVWHALSQPLMLEATKRLRCRPSCYDAEDVVHEVFVRLYEKLVPLVLEKSWPDCAGETIQSPTAYLARVARNLLWDVLRALPRHGYELDTSFYVVDEQSAPYDALIDEDRRRALSRLLSLLDRSDRDCLLLRSSQRWSYKQLGDSFGMSPGTARVRFHRALKKARNLAASPHFSRVDIKKAT